MKVVKKEIHKIIVVLTGILLLVAAPTCYFIAEQNNPNDPKNLNEDMGLPVADTGQTLCYNSAGDTIACDEEPVGGSYPRQDAFYTNKPNARSFTGPIQHPVYISDYTTKDNLTGLVWKSCSEGWDGPTCANDNADPNTYIWENALNSCKALNGKNGGIGYAGYTTWRLPSVQELKTLVYYEQTGPSINTTQFPSTIPDRYWSSTTEISDVDKAWNISFNWGNVGKAVKSGVNYIRCVAEGL